MDSQAAVSSVPYSAYPHPTLFTLDQAPPYLGRMLWEPRIAFAGVKEGRDTGD